MGSDETFGGRGADASGTGVDTCKNAETAVVANGVVGGDCDAVVGTGICASSVVDTVVEPNGGASVSDWDRDMTDIEEEETADFRRGCDVGSRFCREEKLLRLAHFGVA